MSVRYGPPLIAGSAVYGDPGLGRTGAAIRALTATGTHGPGLLYNDWDPGDDAKEFMAVIVTLPSAGTLFVDEYGAFSLTDAPDGTYSLVYKLVVDGVDLGNAPPATITIGVTVYRPGSDIIVNGWTAVGAASLAAAMADASDATYAQSPNLTDPATEAWDNPLPAGTWDIEVRADRTGATGQVRIVCLDGGGTPVGTSSWQTLTGTETTYTLSVTTSATAPNFRIEVQ